MMTDKEFNIIKGFVEAMVENAYSRGTIAVNELKFGYIHENDVDTFLERIRLLVGKEN